jgi:hypothetical protein
MWEVSSLGDTGILGDMASFAPSLLGSVSDSPRAWKDVRRGVVGLGGPIAMSSLDTFRIPLGEGYRSLNAGDGDRAGLGASEKDLGLGVL